MRLILISLLLVGCSSPPKVLVQNVPVYTEILCPGLPKIVELHTRSVLPMAIKDEFGSYWVGISGKDYEHLSYNMQEFLRVVKDQKGIIRYYQKCIVDFNAVLLAQEAEDERKNEAPITGVD